MKKPFEGYQASRLSHSMHGPFDNSVNVTHVCSELTSVDAVCGETCSGLPIPQAMLEHLQLVTVTVVKPLISDGETL